MAKKVDKSRPEYVIEQIGEGLIEVREDVEALVAYFDENGISFGDMYEIISGVAVAHHRLQEIKKHFKIRYDVQIGKER